VLAEDPVADAEAILAREAEFALAAREIRVHADTVADLHGPDVGADFGDVTRDVAARPEGQRRLEGGNALAHEEIEVIERAHAHTHECVVGADLRVRHVPERERLGAAELVERERFHRRASALRPPSPVLVAFTSTAMFP
jgi:hypothetical protein